MTITEPGIYTMSDEEYHADPVPDGSLSHSGAKVIFGQTPQHFRHRTDHGQQESDTLLFGRAVHAKVLGTGADVVIYGDSLRTTEARATKAAALAEGKTPLSAAAAAKADQMAEAVLAHDIARKLLERPGTPEMSMFRIDPEVGIWRRSRADFLPDIGSPIRPIVVDYKSAADASPRGFGKAAASYDYPGQAAWYLADYAALGGDPEALFMFIVQEKEPPHAVAVYQAMPNDLAAGHAYNQAAIRRYAECLAADNWPGYTDHEIKALEVPHWYRDNAPTEGDAA